MSAASSSSALGCRKCSLHLRRGLLPDDDFGESCLRAVGGQEDAKVVAACPAQFSCELLWAVNSCPQQLRRLDSLSGVFETECDIAA